MSDQQRHVVKALHPFGQAKESTLHAMQGDGNHLHSMQLYQCVYHTLCPQVTSFAASCLGFRSCGLTAGSERCYLTKASDGSRGAGKPDMKAKVQITFALKLKSLVCSTRCMAGGHTIICLSVFGGVGDGAGTGELPCWRGKGGWLACCNCWVVNDLGDVEKSASISCSLLLTGPRR